MFAASMVGRLGKDAETKEVNGTKVTDFSIAVDRPKKDADPIWVRCSLWGERGVTAYLKKGTQVAVSGQLDVREYTKSSGEPAFSVELNVNQVTLVGSKQESKPAEDNGGDAPPLE